MLEIVTPEEITEIKEDPLEVIENPSVDITKTLQTKRKISEKQKLALENNRKIRLESERTKKILQKKFNELTKLNVDLDEVIENAKKLKIKNEYEALYGVAVPTKKDNIKEEPKKDPKQFKKEEQRSRRT